MNFYGALLDDFFFTGIPFYQIFVHRLYITVIAIGVDLGKKGSNIPRQISQMSPTTFGILTDIGPSSCWLEAGLDIAAINKVKYVTNGV